MLLPYNTMAQMHFLQFLQIIWYHNFYCCSSYHERVQKGLKVKHQANKLHCLVPVVLDELQTMKIEQPGNTEQSEILQWPLWAGSRCGTSMTPPQPLGFLPVCALLQGTCKSMMRNGSSGYENQVWPRPRCCNSGPIWVLLGYEKDTVCPQMVMFIVRHFQINEEAI